MKLSERVKRLEEKIEKLEGNWLEGNWLEGNWLKGNWTKIGDLEWSKNLGQMDWFEAKKKCESLGGRLPTRIELLDLYDNHYDECKKLDDGYFWSATELSDNTSNAWLVRLLNGNTVNYNKSNSYDVRCVRDKEGAFMREEEKEIKDIKNKNRYQKCVALQKALDYAIRIIESYQMDIRNSKYLDFIGIDLQKKGFCQGEIYREAIRDIKKLSEEKNN